MSFSELGGNYRPIRRTRFIQNLCNPLLSLPHLSRVYIFALFPKNHHLIKYVIPVKETNYNEGKHLKFLYLQRGRRSKQKRVVAFFSSDCWVTF